MNHLEQLAVTAEFPVFVLSNADGTDCEFLSLSPMASESEVEALMARWAGRNLTESGVAGLVSGIPRLALKEQPSDFMVVVRLTAAFARYVEDVNVRTAETCIGDSVAFCERLYALQDPRP